MGLSLLSLGTLVPAAPCCVSYASRHQILIKYSDLISHTQTDKNTQDTSGTNRMTYTYKYILTQPIICTQQPSILQLMNNFLIQKITLQRSTMYGFS